MLALLSLKPDVNKTTNQKTVLHRSTNCSVFCFWCTYVQVRTSVHIQFMYNANWYRHYILNYDLDYFTLFTTCPGTIASHTTDFPLPSIQFTPVAFLSEQKLPLKLNTSIVGKCPCKQWSAFSVPWNIAIVFEKLLYLTQMTKKWGFILTLRYLPHTCRYWIKH